MDARELERFLHREIPLTVPMGLRVASLDERHLALAAPLAENRNDKHTAFGGSIASLLVLAGWGLLHVTLLRSGRPADIMIQQSTITFAAPVATELTAECARPPAEAWRRFLTGLDRRGVARIALGSELAGEAGAAARLEGRYVARLRAS